ncbi:hypothetical protein V2S66_29735 [Streptomyces sp. V4-01]|uniref:Uncharacterized protein n=1 Tax=Actinacidiphila polyblastidii TaxID=3110430 RepID=A0ABU7PJY1_9ACTN|nr:hypothetical protein [Streptomyces sp. V4-01]
MTVLGGLAALHGGGPAAAGVPAWPGPLRPLLSAGPFVAAVAAFVISPGVHVLLAAVLEGRRVRVRQEFTAVVYGDPLLAAACGLGVLLAPTGPPAAMAWAARPPGILLPAAGWLAYGVVQWAGELRRGFYTSAQAWSPTKIWHQLGVYPLLWAVAGSAGLAGLLSPAHGGGPVAWRWAAKAGIALCVAGWAALNVYDRGHPRLGHPPFVWRRLRPAPRPWPPDSTTLRANRADDRYDGLRNEDISSPPRGDMSGMSGRSRVRPDIPVRTMEVSLPHDPRPMTGPLRERTVDSMTTQRGDADPDRQRERHDARRRVNRLLAAFLAAIPFAAVLNVLQDWLGNGISSSQTGLLAGVLALLAFLVYAAMTASADTADEGRTTRAALRELRDHVDVSFDEFRDRTGAYIKYLPARRGPESNHLQQAEALYRKAGEVIDKAQDGDEILAVNSFVEVFHQRSDPAVERLQEEYLRRIENRFLHGVAYHRLIQLPSLDVLDRPSVFLSDSVEPSYLRHYRRVISLKTDAPGQGVSLDAVTAKYPMSFVVVKRKNNGRNTGGTIILQVNEHIPVNGVPESAHFQLTGIHIVEDTKGDVVNHYLDWFRELQHGQRSLTHDDLRSRDDQHPVA